MIESNIKVFGSLISQWMYFILKRHPKRTIKVLLKIRQL